MVDFITPIQGPLSTLAEFQNKIIAHRAGADRDATALDVELRKAPIGRDAIFEAFRAGVSMGTVTVPAGTLRPVSPTVISLTITAGQLVTWTVNQVGTGPGDDVGATANCFVRIAP